MTKIQMRLAALGWTFPPGVHVYLLEVRGRKTGLIRTVPVLLTDYDGRRWLVSLFREASWVANLQAAGQARLSRGGRSETIHAVEVTDERRMQVAMQIRRFTWWNPWVPSAFPAGPRDGLTAFRAEADRHPVFLIVGPADNRPATAPQPVNVPARSDSDG